MVSVYTILALCASLLCCLVFPVVLCIVYMRKTRPGAVPLLVGIGVFIGFALVLEQILHYLVLQAIPGTRTLLNNNIWLYALYGALAAGIFEECGRLLGMSVFMKKKHEWKHGVTYGIGHGGIEALLIVAPSVITYLVFAVMINTNTFDAMIDTLPASSAMALAPVKQALLTQSPWLFALGGYERVCAITVQIALSLLVLYAVSSKKYRFFWLAILLHAALDYPAVLAQGGIISMYAVEGIVGVFAVASLIFILKSKKLFPAPPAAPVPEPDPESVSAVSA